MVSTSALVFCFAITIAQGKVDWDEARKHMEQCRQETGAEETFESVLIKEEMPKTDKGMCLIECYLRGKGFYDEEGNFNSEGATTHLKKVFEDKPEVIEKAIAIANECSKIDIEGLNKCEAAVKHVSCAKLKAAQQNITIDKN